MSARNARFRTAPDYSDVYEPPGYHLPGEPVVSNRQTTSVKS